MIFDDNFFKAGENSPVSYVEDEARMAGVCLAELRGKKEGHGGWRQVWAALAGPLSVQGWH